MFVSKDKNNSKPIHLMSTNTLGIIHARSIIYI